MRRRPTVGEWVEEWLQQEALSHPRTAATYRIKARYFVVALDERKLHKVCANDIRAVLIACRAKGRSDTTIAHVFRTVSTMFEAAKQQGIVERNPCAEMKAPPRSHFEATTLTDEQVARLSEAAQNRGPFGVAVLLTLATGIRRGELLALQWRDVDFARHKLHVTKSVSYDPVPRVGFPKTRSSRRILPLDPRMVAILRRMRGDDNALIFPSRTGRHKNPRVFNEQWHSLLKQAGVPRCRFHDLRHTAGLIITRNAGLPVASLILGHSSPSITARFYGHAQERDIMGGLEGLADTVFGPS